MTRRVLSFLVFQLGVMSLLPGSASGAGPKIKHFAASPSGKYVAYVIEQEHHHEVWLRREGEKDRVLLSAERLKKINYTYASTVTDLAWSPSERCSWR